MGKKSGTGGTTRGKIRKLNDRVHEYRTALAGMVTAVDYALGAEDHEQSFHEQEMAAVGLRQATEAAHKVLGGVEWDEWGQWEAWEGAVVFPNMPADERPAKVFRNKIYEVWVRLMPLLGDENNPVIAELSIKRRDKLPIDHNHWRTIQRIKDEVLGINVDAAMLYPCAARLQDSANQYRVYAMPQGMLMPFGDTGRMVSSLALAGDDNPRTGPRQRPFPPGERKADDLVLHDDRMAACRTFVADTLDEWGEGGAEE